MKYLRGRKALIGLAVLLVSSLSQAQSPAVNAQSGPQASLTLAAVDSSMYSGTRRAGTIVDHGLKVHHDVNRVQAALTTPVLYPTAQGGVVPNGGRGGELKGWVLLLMGTFLIITISQRRYQALSDI
jgi:hypothetical protein